MNTHVLQKELVISPAEMTPVTGTWALATSSNISSYDKTATDETATIWVPISIPTTRIGQKIRVNSIQVMHFIGTDDLDAAIVDSLDLEDWDATVAAGITGAAPTGAAVTCTDDFTVTLGTNWKCGTITVTTPTFVNASGTGGAVNYMLKLVADAGTNTVLKMGPVRVLYDEA